MKRQTKKFTVTVMSGLLAASLLSGCGSDQKLDGTKTVATVNGVEIPLGVVSLYARRSQAQTESIYRMYFGVTSGIWDGVADEESGETYGDDARQGALDQIELLYLLKEKAADYGVTLSDEDHTAISEAAAAFLEANSEETLETLAVNQELVEAYLELETIEARIREPIEAEAEIDIDEDAAQQSSYSYVEFSFAQLESEEDEEDEESDDEDIIVLDEDEEAVEEVADDAEEAVEEAADDTEEAVEEAADDAEEAVEEAADDAEEAVEEAADDAEEAVEEAADDAEEAVEEAADDAEEAVEEAAVTKEELFQKANQLLGALKVNPEADLAETATAIDDSLYADTDTFTTAESDEEWLANTDPEELLEALRTLEDGQIYDGVIETEDGYYVVRLDKVKDEDATQAIIDDRSETLRSEYYDTITQEWKDAADVTVDDKVLSTLTITDSHTFTLVYGEDEEDEELTEDAEVIEGSAEDAEEIAEEAADEAEEAVEDAAEDAEETAEELTEDVTEAE